MAKSKQRKGVKPRGRYYRKRTTGTTNLSTAVKSYVKRQIRSNIENKIQNVEGINSFGSIQEDSTLGAFPMCPYTGIWSIGQGVTQNTRVGNVIKPVRVMLKYVMYPNPYNATTNPAPYPVEVDLMLGYHRQNPSLIPNSTLINELFQNGNTQTPPVGDVGDLVSDINKDAWIIKKRWRHKIGFASATGTGSQVGAQYHSNNDFKFNVVKKINITKLLPAKLHFNDGGSMTDRGLFLMFQAVPATGGVGAAVVTPVTIHYWVHFEYEDA